LIPSEIFALRPKVSLVLTNKGGKARAFPRVTGGKPSENGENEQALLYWKQKSELRGKYRPKLTMAAADCTI